MENKLYNLGCEFKKIREILGFTQEQIAKLIGVSKPFIVNLERFPEKMSKIVAISLISNVYYELKRRRLIYEHLDFSLLVNEDAEAQRAIRIITEELKFTQSFYSRTIKYSRMNNDNIIKKVFNSIYSSLTDISMKGVFAAMSGKLSGASNIIDEKMRQIISDLIHTYLTMVEISIISSLKILFIQIEESALSIPKEEAQMFEDLMAQFLKNFAKNSHEGRSIIKDIDVSVFIFLVQMLEEQ